MPPSVAWLAPWFNIPTLGVTCLPVDEALMAANRPSQMAAEVGRAAPKNQPRSWSGPDLARCSSSSFQAPRRWRERVCQGGGGVAGDDPQSELGCQNSRMRHLSFVDALASGCDEGGASYRGLGRRVA